MPGKALRRVSHLLSKNADFAPGCGLQVKFRRVGSLPNPGVDRGPETHLKSTNGASAAKSTKTQTKLLSFLLFPNHDLLCLRGFYN